jgi:hypothetical protein
MRKIVLLAALFLSASFPAIAGHFDPDGKFEGKVSAGIQNATHAFERTHDTVALRRTVTKLVEHDPSLADDAVYVSTNLPADEQTEIAKALAAAYADLAAKDPKSAGFAAIKAALTFAPRTFQTAFKNETDQLLGVASATGAAGGAGGNGGSASGNGGGGGGGGGFAGAGAPSPAAPGGSVSPN